jgi:integrase
MAIIPRKHSYGVRIYRPNTGTKWIGSFAFKDYGGKREALKAAKEAEAQALAYKARKTVLVGKYLDGYLDDYAKDNKDSSFATARAALATFKKEFGHLPLSDEGFESVDAEDWARKHPSCVPSVVTFLNHASSRREIALTYNPFKGLSRKSRGRRDKVPLSAEGVEALAWQAYTHHREFGPMMRALILFAAHSALRPGELFALEWSDIDFERMRIKVQRRVYKGRLALPKNNRTREAVLTPQARDALLPLDRSTQHVFESKTGRRLSQSSLSGYWTPVSRNFGERPDKNGVMDLVDFYEFRHRCAFWMYVELGMPDRVVAAQLGHTDGGKLIRELYGHGDHGALEEIDRAFVDNVKPILRETKGA